MLVRLPDVRTLRRDKVELAWLLHLPERSRFHQSVKPLSPTAWRQSSEHSSATRFGVRVGRLTRLTEWSINSRLCLLTRTNTPSRGPVSPSSHRYKYSEQQLRNVPPPPLASIQGAAVEVKGSPGNQPSSQPTTRTAAAAETDVATNVPGENDFRTKGEAREAAQAERGPNGFVRAVGEPLSLCGLRPSTTYRVTLEVPVLVRDDLLESAR